MRHAAVARRFVAARKAARAARLALAGLRRERRAGEVPHVLAAEWILIAHGFAAVEVAAVRVVVREAAVAGVRSSARRIRASLGALGVEPRTLGAGLVPDHVAAVGVEQADPLAAGFIVAPWGRLRLAAGARADIAAAGLVPLAASDRVDPVDAELVPLDVAAVFEVRNAADRAAAVGVAAPGPRMGHVAAGQADLAAIRNEEVAELPRTHGAGLLPAKLAAGRVDGADGLGARRIAAASQIRVSAEAVARDRESAAAGARDLRGADAGEVPAPGAAERIEAADRLAARRVVAEWSLVRLEAVAGTAVAASDFAAADAARDGHAAGVPAIGAAKRVDGAHAGATDLVVASGLVLAGIEAAALARAVRVGFRPAERPRGADAVAAPRDFAAERIRCADDLAAGCVAATRGGAHRPAAAARRAPAERHADCLRRVHARLVPSDAAADGIDRANRLAAGRVVASGGSVDGERTAGSRAVRGVQVADVDGGECAGFVPCALAAGWVKLADEVAALLVLAGGDEARHRARTSAGVAAGRDIRADRRSDGDAEDVPFDRAADRIDVAHVLAAGAVEACGRRVREEAASRADGAAVGADDLCARHAVRIPPRIAAAWVDRAHRGAAGVIGAPGRRARAEATSRRTRADEVDVGIGRQGALGLGALHAGRVPADGAAERIDRADLVAADEIAAARQDVDRAAGQILSGDRGVVAAAALWKVADAVWRRGKIGAGGIPRRGAAERIDDADRLAAGAVVAVRAVVRMAAAAGARVAAGEAELICELDAGAVPRDVAAPRIDRADLLAADRVVAVGILMRNKATACRRLAARIGDDDGEGHAGSIPLGAAACRLDRADRLAHGSVVARGRRMRDEATLGNSAAVRAELGGEGHAEVVPRGGAAGGLDRADERTARRVAASAGEKVRREAVVGGVHAALAVGLGRKAADRKQDRSHDSERRGDAGRAEAAEGSEKSHEGVHRLDRRALPRQGLTLIRIMPALRPAVSLKGAPMMAKPGTAAAE